MKRDADIATAEADKETRIKRAEASKEAQKAELERATEIAEAEKLNQLKIAEFRREQDIAKAKADQDKKDAVAVSEARKQKIVLWSVISGLMLVLGFAGFIFRSLRITGRQKQLIEQQKHLVEEKQKEILDSIRYAKRIQTALMPTEKYIDKTLKRLMKNS